MDPVRVGDRALCSTGVRACVDGRLTECRPDQMRVQNALVVGPEACNPCSPTCAISTDRPNDADLTSENSENVEFDPAQGGVVLVGMDNELFDDDGDGVPNEADECPGAGWRAPCGSGADGFYHTLPFGGLIETDPVSFGIEVTTADLYFLMDTTGSMGDEIANLRASLTSGTIDSSCAEGVGGGIMGAIRCVIPNAWFGVGRFDDYPVCAGGSSCYGWSPDVVFEHLVDLTDNLAAPASAVGTFVASGGGDGPESNTQALWAIATGSSLGSFLPSRSGCPAGRWGYPCFRPDTIPIVVMLTDAPFHEGPGNVNPYNPFVLPASIGKDWNETIAALNAQDVRVITVQSCGGQSWCAAGESHAMSLGTATSSVDLTGDPYVFTIPQDGTGLDVTVVDAVRDLAENTLFDVTARAVDNPATPGVDETDFVESIVAFDFPPGRCAGVTASRFVQCQPGTDVDFRVNFQNDFLPESPVAQVFEFTIEVLLDGAVQNSVPVRVVVPPRPSYPPTGSYERIYDATEFCNIPPDRPNWSDLDWTVLTPAGTTVSFEIRTANSEAELASATPVVVDIPPTSAPVNVGALLDTSGRGNRLPYLEVRSVLRASADLLETPTLIGFDLTYVCEIVE